MYFHALRLAFLVALLALKQLESSPVDTAPETPTNATARPSTLVDIPTPNQADKLDSGSSSKRILRWDAFLDPQHLDRVKRWQKLNPKDAAAAPRSSYRSAQLTDNAPKNVWLSCPFPGNGSSIQGRLLAGQGSRPTVNTYGSRQDETQQGSWRSAPENQHPYYQPGYYTTVSPYENWRSRGEEQEYARTTETDRSRERDRYQTDQYATTAAYDQGWQDRSQTAEGSNAGGRFNLGVEIEILRFTNTREAYADGRPCGSAEDPDGNCNYRFTGHLDLGDGEGSKPSVIANSPGRTYADVNMRTRRFACGLSAIKQSTVLQVAVTAPTTNATRQPRQAVSSYSARGHLENDQTYRPAPDQYSRDRYDDRRAETENQYSRQEASYSQQGSGTGARSPEAGLTGGDFVDMFDCVMDFRPAAQSQIYNAEWKTANCVSPHPSTEMELMFRYIVYGMEASECEHQKAASPDDSTWKPLGSS